MKKCEERPNYYSVIPANVRYDNDLKSSEKLLYGEISALCNKEGYCFATNSYFAKLYSTQKETVSRWIANLQNRGYISIKLIRKENKEVEKRHIYLLTKKSIPIDEKVNTPIDEKVKGNITSNEYSYINKDIVEYLNKKSNKNFKHSSNKTQSLIKARLNEGFTLDDFKKVIDIKTEEWIDTDMEKFLRPETLFSNKFEGYLNQEGRGNGKNKKQNVPDYILNQEKYNSTNYESEKIDDEEQEEINHLLKKLKEDE